MEYIDLPHLNRYMLKGTEMPNIQEYSLSYIYRFSNLLISRVINCSPDLISNFLTYIFRIVAIFLTIKNESCLTSFV